MQRHTASVARQTACCAVALSLAILASATGCLLGGADEPSLAVVFDGDSCTYDGPESVPAGDVRVSFANDSDGPMGLAFLALPTGMDVDPGVGEDGPISGPEPPRGIEVVGVLELDAGEDADEVAALAPGRHVLDCVRFGTRGPEHFWRGAILDVVR